MTIRITGMNSGLDTESIISELASARSVKVSSLQKAQTKLSWKIDAWKGLNTKIYSLFTDKLDDMRFSTAYSKKTTKVSNSSIATVITGEKAMNGTQRLNVTKLAKTGYLTGAKMSRTDGKKVAEDTTLEELGYSGNAASFELTVNGETKSLTFNKTSKVSDVLKRLREEGLNANLDTENGRVFVSSAKSGSLANFTLKADGDSFQALAALGLNAEVVPVKTKADYQEEKAQFFWAMAQNEIYTEEERDLMKSYLQTDADGNPIATLSTEGVTEVERLYAAYTRDINAANANHAVKIDGDDAEIYLNEAKFEFSSNTFEINGLTFNIDQLTDTDGVPRIENSISITTETDTSGIYDMIKGFLKQYNELIKEMDTLYNADSASKYEPLTSEEKDEMSDKEIEEWEKKIKDSLLRRDSTLSTVSSALKEIMLSGFKVKDKNGVESKMHLSDFGISTLSYFSAPDNEKGVYHIDGDPDDVNTRNNADKLKSLIANDPDVVTGFFTQLNAALYSKLNDLMARTDYSSAYKVYNDKLLDTEYKNYETKVKDEQKKLTDYTDRWYKKFSEMEVAMAKLDSKTNAITNMLG